jgi:hypothetical protein
MHSMPNEAEKSAVLAALGAAGCDAGCDSWCVCRLDQLSGSDLTACKAGNTPQSNGWCFVDGNETCQANVGRPNAILFHPAIPAENSHAFALGCYGTDIGNPF